MGNGTKIVCNKTTKLRNGKISKMCYRGMTALFNRVDEEKKKIVITLDKEVWFANPKDWEEM